MFARLSLNLLAGAAGSSSEEPGCCLTGVTSKSFALCVSGFLNQIGRDKTDLLYIHSSIHHDAQHPVGRHFKMRSSRLL